MLELYNMTSEIRRVPKYRYNGKYVLAPFASVDIEDDTAYFFKPYARVGVVVRKKMSDIKVVHKDAEQQKEVQSEEIVKPVLPDEKKKEEVSVPVETEIETPTTTTDDELAKLMEGDSTEVPLEKSASVENTGVKVYSEADLEVMGIADLRKVAKSLGLDAEEVKRKVDIRTMILENQKA